MLYLQIKTRRRAEKRGGAFICDIYNITLQIIPEELQNTSTLQGSPK